MKVVVVHRGARDAYQAALAMAEVGQLERLITDLYWSDRSRLAKLSRRVLGSRVGRIIGAHENSPIDPGLVETCPGSSLLSFGMDKIPHTPFTWRASATRWTDRSLGRLAGQIASEAGAALLSYSYYAHSAFSAASPDTPRLLFQLHPHPATMRQLLRAELEDHPECADSLQKEWELALAEEDFQRMCEEASMADEWIAASSFTRRTLIENGADPNRVHVATYGVNLVRFHPGERTRGGDGPLRILFVGTVNQRKGIKYLLEAVCELGTRQIELVIRGRAVDDLSLVRRMAPNANIRLSVSHEDLLSAYQTCDLFVFPSIGEGFGHVLLESLASGLPVLSTTHTAAPDLVTPGVDGFVVEPRRPDLIAERLEWALMHRSHLVAMRKAAREKAEQFTWTRFRKRMRSVVGGALPAEHSEEGAMQHV